MKQIILIILTFLSFGFIKAQDGTIDQTFNASDTGYGCNGILAYSNANINIFQNDKILYSDNINGFTTFKKLDENGVKSANFATSSQNLITVSGYAGSAIQSDGKILIYGTFQQFNGVNQKHIARINLDGSLDTTFSTNLSNYVFNILDLKVLPDGKIQVFISLTGSSDYRLICLNTDGSIDNNTGFNAAAVGGGEIIKAKIQSNAKVVIYSKTTVIAGLYTNNIKRLNSDGTIDTSFQNGTINSTDFSISTLHYSVDEIVEQTDGKIVLGGNFTTYNGVANNNYIIRLNDDGTLDTTFHSYFSLSSNSPSVKNIKIQTNGKLLISGSFSEQYNGNYFPYNGFSINKIARLNNDGTLDTSFNCALDVSKQLFDFDIQSDNKIVVSTEKSNPNTSFGKDIFINRLNLNGTIDYTFVSNPSANVNCTSILKSDGKIMIYSPDLKVYNGQNCNQIAFLNNDGSYDNSFQGLGLTTEKIVTTYLQADQKMLIYLDSGRFVRLNSNGTIDLSVNFSFNSAYSSSVKSIAVQNDGKIIVLGQGLIKRINTDGTLDLNFNNYLQVYNSEKNNIFILPNQKIIVCGSIYINTQFVYSVLLNSDGSTDLILPGFVEAIQPDGKLIISGMVDSNPNTVFPPILRRYYPDGTLDSSFNMIPLAGVNYYSKFSAVVCQPDGKILFGFKTPVFYMFGEPVYNINTNIISRLNYDGSLDTSFSTFIYDISTASKVNSIYVQPDGRILASGDFRSCDGTKRNYLVRFNNSLLDFNDFNFEDNDLNIYKDYFNALHIKINDNEIYSVSIYDITGRQIYKNIGINSSKLTIDNLKINNQILIVKVTNISNRSISKKIIF